MFGIPEKDTAFIKDGVKRLRTVDLESQLEDPDGFEDLTPEDLDMLTDIEAATTIPADSGAYEYLGQQVDKFLEGLGYDTGHEYGIGEILVLAHNYMRDATGQHDSSINQDANSDAKSADIKELVNLETSPPTICLVFNTVYSRIVEVLMERLSPGLLGKYKLIAVASNFALDLYRYSSTSTRAKSVNEHATITMVSKVNGTIQATLIDPYHNKQLRMGDVQALDYSQTRGVEPVVAMAIKQNRDFWKGEGLGEISANRLEAFTGSLLIADNVADNVAFLSVFTDLYLNLSEFKYRMVDKLNRIRARIKKAEEELAVYQKFESIIKTSEYDDEVQAYIAAHPEDMQSKIKNGLGFGWLEVPADVEQTISETKKLIEESSQAYTKQRKQLEVPLNAMILLESTIDTIIDQVLVVMNNITFIENSDADNNHQIRIAFAAFAFLDELVANGYEVDSLVMERYQQFLDRIDLERLAVYIGQDSRLAKVIRRSFHHNWNSTTSKTYSKGNPGSAKHLFKVKKRMYLLLANLGIESWIDYLNRDYMYQEEYKIFLQDLAETLEKESAYSLASKVKDASNHLQ